MNLWFAGALAIFVLGLTGFALATSLVFWVIAMVVFTVGEIIVFPRRIHVHRPYRRQPSAGHVLRRAKPQQPRGGPGAVLCGAVLAAQSADYIFYMLMLFIVTGGGLYFLRTSLPGNIEVEEGD